MQKYFVAFLQGNPIKTKLYLHNRLLRAPKNKIIVFRKAIRILKFCLKVFELEKLCTMYNVHMYNYGRKISGKHIQL